MKLKYFCTIAEGFFKLPYRVVFAVATFNSLYVYDTESVAPILIHAGLHYAAITDIAWWVLVLQQCFLFPLESSPLYKIELVLFGNPTGTKIYIFIICAGLLMQSTWHCHHEMVTALLLSLTMRNWASRTPSLVFVTIPFSMSFLFLGTSLAHLTLWCNTLWLIV